MMSSPIFDFSHLSPEERIQLAEELWDSLETADLPVSEDLGAELDRRLERHRQDPGRGRPAEDVLRDIEQRGR
jgi:putative addiction module component (TIGR02574 family)